ncbi:hypothetical protein HXX76_014045 [Chlamydomonas incerta]|uniref:Chromo domain-containing protein n=1 Tax=Chlamydomonas incerta TaxID=51695 RepID=A0A835VPY7_CHLIN|nr:hypothetical protein HXX76_014045 [Chlamydomonas incerta]|eukprot:KAG2424887.1 hypothetical protein HXX76_014045 [Chlamydomonas incerta]
MATFTKDDLRVRKTHDTIKDLAPELQTYYIPCKYNVYVATLLDESIPVDVRVKKCITVLRQILRMHSCYILSNQVMKYGEKKVHYTLVTSLLNKLTAQNCKKLTPALLSVIEADHTNGMKLLDHCCINVDRMAVFLDVLSLVTYKHELSAKFASDLSPHTRALLAAWCSGDHADYDLFCKLQKMLGSLRARMRILEMFVARGLIPTADMRDLVACAMSDLREVELQIACMESVSRCFWPQTALPGLLEQLSCLPFKLRFKTGLVGLDKLLARKKAGNVEFPEEGAQAAYNGMPAVQKHRVHNNPHRGGYMRTTGTAGSFQVDVMLLPKRPNNARYALVLVHILSRYAFVYSMGSKSDANVLKCFDTFMSDIEGFGVFSARLREVRKMRIVADRAGEAAATATAAAAAGTTGARGARGARAAPHPRPRSWEPCKAAGNASSACPVSEPPFGISGDAQFGNAQLKDALQQRGFLVQTHIAYMDHNTGGDKLGVIDRFIRTLRRLLSLRADTSGAGLVSNAMLAECVENYNTTPHSSLRLDGKLLSPEDVLGGPMGTRNSRAAAEQRLAQLRWLNSQHNKRVGALLLPRYPRLGEQVRVYVHKADRTQLGKKASQQFSSFTYTVKGYHPGTSHRFVVDGDPCEYKYHELLRNATPAPAPATGTGAALQGGEEPYQQQRREARTQRQRDAELRNLGVDPAAAAAAATAQASGGPGVQTRGRRNAGTAAAAPTMPAPARAPLPKKPSPDRIREILLDREFLDDDDNDAVTAGPSSPSQREYYVSIGDGSGAQDRVWVPESALNARALVAYWSTRLGAPPSLQGARMKNAVSLKALQAWVDSTPDAAASTPPPASLTKAADPPKAPVPPPEKRDYPVERLERHILANDNTYWYEVKWLGWSSRHNSLVHQSDITKAARDEYWARKRAEDYEVDRLLRHVVDNKGKRLYEVSWVGYGSDENRMVPEKDINRAALDSYWDAFPKRRPQSLRGSDDVGPAKNN